MYSSHSHSVVHRVSQDGEYTWDVHVLLGGSRRATLSPRTLDQQQATGHDRKMYISTKGQRRRVGSRQPSALTPAACLTYEN
uniref:Uncharacterized protein n=1 Tax=Knipowitschia caucasica TaxID=637954 RepID=A0AAV2MJK4_KNICA